MNELLGALSSIGVKYEMILEGIAELVLREHFENLGLHMPHPLKSSFADSSLESIWRENANTVDTLSFLLSLNISLVWGYLYLFIPAATTTILVKEN